MTLNIKKLLYKLGFDYVWLAGGTGNHKAFMSDFKERIYDLARRHLYDNIMVARKSEVYKDICPYVLDGKWPNYHVLGLSKTNIISITCFKARNHQLKCETGKWARPKIPAEERVCLVCNEIEDEVHIVCVCALYMYKYKYTSNEFITENPRLGFSALFNSDRKVHLDNLAIFIKKCTELHQLLFLN